MNIITRGFVMACVVAEELNTHYSQSTIGQSAAEHR